MAPPKKLDPSPTVTGVQALIAALRAENGCPWDRKQTPISLSVYLIEETYELVEAIQSDEADAIGEELGDVLFQILFLVHLYEQAGRLSLSDVLARNLEKMIRRHPHVFGNDHAADADQVKRRWREIKQQEKASADTSLMDSVPAGMPALMRAYRISERAAGAGFDWDALQGVIDQTEREWAEFKAELRPAEPGGKPDRQKAAMEFGDVLFTMVNVARLAGIHPETSLVRSTQKFIQRFRQMEAMAAERRQRIEDVPRDELEQMWERAKKAPV